MPAALVHALGDRQLSQLGLQIRLERGPGPLGPLAPLAAHSRRSVWAGGAFSDALHLHDDAASWQYAMHAAGAASSQPAWRAPMLRWHSSLEVAARPVGAGPIQVHLAHWARAHSPALRQPGEQPVAAALPAASFRAAAIPR